MGAHSLPARAPLPIVSDEMSVAWARWIINRVRGDRVRLSSAPVSVSSCGGGGGGDGGMTEFTLCLCHMTPVTPLWWTRAHSTTTAPSIHFIVMEPRWHYLLHQEEGGAAGKRQLGLYYFAVLACSHNWIYKSRLAPTTVRWPNSLLQPRRSNSRDLWGP